MRISRALLASAATFVVCSAAQAQSPSPSLQMYQDQLNVMNQFSLLGNTEEGRALLKANMEENIRVNNNATRAEQLLSLMGQSDTPNGITMIGAPGAPSSVSPTAGLGATLGAAYLKLNPIVGTDSIFFSADAKRLWTYAGNIFGDPKGWYANGTDNKKPNPFGVLPPGGKFGVYDDFYQGLYGPYDEDPVGSTRPFRIAPGKFKIFEPGPKIDGVMITNEYSWGRALPTSPGFPSGHTQGGYRISIMQAMMFPERFQELLTSGAWFGHDRVVLGVHHTLDVIGGRLWGMSDAVNLLNNNPDYLNHGFFGTEPVSDFWGLFSSVMADQRARMEKECGASIAECAARDQGTEQEWLAKKAANKAFYRYVLTYNLPSVGRTDLAPVVPTGAEVLLKTRFPYLTAEQRREVLATTELPSGVPLDGNTDPKYAGYARLDLYTAGDGYGAFRDNVHVTMDASKGGFNKFDIWGNDISGVGGLRKSGTGELRLTGNNSYTGATVIDGGLLSVNGSIVQSDVTVENGGTLGGYGKVGDTTVNKGGTIAPGTSIGILTVSGNFTQQDGSTYSAELDPSGKSDLIKVTGKATIGDDAVLDVTGKAAVGTRYTLLSADGGLTGAYTLKNEMLSSFISLGGIYLDDVYDAKNVYVDALQSRALKEAALTPNQTATAQGVDSLAASDNLRAAVLNLQTDDAARDAFNQLSGDLHASAKGALVEDSRLIRNAIDNRLRAAFGDASANAVEVTAYGKDGPVAASAASDRFVVWGQGFTAFGDTDGGDAAGLDRDTDGFLIGADGSAGNWRIGLIGGYSQSSFEAEARNATAESDNLHLGLYAGTEWGKLAFRSGFSYSRNDIETSRVVAFDGLSNQLTADYNAATTQVFGELGYKVDAGKVQLQPFANLAYVNVDTDGFTEKGGAAALTSAGEGTSVPFTTLGVRAATKFNLGSVTATARATVGWRHAFEDTPEASFAFGNGDTFTIAGAPIAQDAAVVEAGLDVAFSPKATLGLQYSGQLASRAQDHAFSANLNIKF